MSIFAFSIIFIFASLFLFTVSLKYAFSQGLNLPLGSTINVNTGTLRVIGTVDINGTLQTSTGTVGVTGDWDNRDGTYTSNTGTVDLRKATGTQLIYSSGIGADKLFYNLTHSGTGYAYAQNSNINIDGSFTNSAGTLDSNGYDITIAKNWTNNATFAYGTKTVTFNGTGQGASGQYVNGSTTFWNLTKIVSGASPETILFDSSVGAEQNVKGILNLEGTGTTTRLEIRSNVDGVQGKLNLNTDGLQVMTYLDVQDSWASGLTLVGRTPASVDSGNNTNWTFGSVTVTWDGDVSTVWDNPYNWSLGLVPIDGDSIIIPGGPVNQPVLTTNISLTDVTLEAGGVTGSSFTLDGYNLTITDTLDNEGIVYLQGGEVVNINNIDPDSGTFYFTGDGDGNPDTFVMSDIGANDFYNVVIDLTDSDDVIQTNGDLTILGDLTVTKGTLDISTNGNTLAVEGDILVNGGTLTATGSDIDANGDVTISSGTLTAPGSGKTLAIYGNYDHQGGTFTHSSSTVNFDNDGGNQSISGSSTFYNLTKVTTTAATLTFEAGEEQTIASSGLLNLQGSSGELLSIVSSNPGTQTSINLTSGALQSIYYADVSDNNASGLTLVARASVNSGNNTNWVFGAATITWQGDLTDNWDTPGNWDLGLVPNADDIVTIPDVAGSDPILYSNVNIEELIVEIGGVVTADGYDLIVDGELSNEGNIQLDGDESNATFGTYDIDSGTFTYLGDDDGIANTHIVKDFGDPDYYNLAFNDQNATPDIFQTVGDLSIAGTLNVTGGTLDISTNANTMTNTGLLTVDGGTINALNSNIDVNSSFVLSAGEIIAPGAGLLFTVADDWTNSGGTFTHSNGKVTFDTVDEAIVTGDTTFYDLRIRDASKIVTFAVGSTQTVEGDFDVRANNPNIKIVLRSQTSGQKWSVSFPNGEQDALYLNVSDSDALLNTITCFNCTDGGNNNTNWFFIALSITIPDGNRTIDQQPTIMGITESNYVVTVKGYVGTVLTQIGTVIADINGNFFFEVPTEFLDIGANELIPFVGILQGPTTKNLTVTATPTTDQVSIIDSHVDGDRVHGALPTFTGFGLAGESLEVVAMDELGALLYQTVGTGLVDTADSRYSVTPSPLVKAVNYIAVVINGVASDILEIKLTDPFGIAFDSFTNHPINDAIVSLYRTSDNQLATIADGDLDITDVNPVIVDSDGFYSYICADGDYYITINALGYDYPSAKTTFPSDRVIVTGSKGEVFNVASAIIEMDQPADANGNVMRVEKDANKKEVKVGDVVTYTVTIENLTTATFIDVYLEDRIPPGFKFLEGRVTLDGDQADNPLGQRPLSFYIDKMTGNQKREFKYQLVVGSGVTLGDYENIAWARYWNWQLLSNYATEHVKVVLDPLFDLGTVIGKVFLDKNENGVQDMPEYNYLDRDTYIENPVPKVRIAMEDGTVVTTDEEGRFSVPALTPGRHLFRLDERSLPDGSYLTTDKVVVVDVTPGLLVKVNFGVNLDYDRFRSEDQHFFMKDMKVSQDKSKPTPRLNVAMFTDEIPIYNDVFSEAAEFRIFANYAPFIKKWKLEIIDKDVYKTIKSFEGNNLNIHDPIYWDGLDKTGEHVRTDRNYVYLVYVEDEKGDYDETVLTPIKFNFIEDEEALKTYKLDRLTDWNKKYRQWISEELKKSNMFVQSILVEGETVTIDRLSSAKIQSVRVLKDGQIVSEVPLLAKQGFTASELLGEEIKDQRKDDKLEIILPKGDYEISVGEGAGSSEIDGARLTNGDLMLSEGFTDTKEIIGSPVNMYSKKIKVGEDYLFFVGMGDAKIGYTFNKGNIEPVQSDEKYKGGFWSEGKMAYFLQGKVLGKYLITSSFDSQREQKELFKDLDPDQYYPIYGDSSELDTEATDTQSSLYLMLEWDKSSVQWSNYEVAFDETEFAQFSRTLFGGKINFESLSTTEYGESKTKVVAFHSRVKQKAAHNEFLATGGSLYFLKHRDVIEGSDSVKVEVRDRITGLMISETEMKEGADYELDYDSGRIIFWMPVSMMIQSYSIISNDLLEGNLVYVTADYEYDTKDKTDEGSEGVRVRQAITDSVLVGATYVRESQEDSNYELKGTDLTLHLGPNATIKAEYAESESGAKGTYVSTDGGISFTDLSSSDVSHGKAYGISSDAKLFNRLGLTSYYKWIDNGFSSADSVSQQGKETVGFKGVYDLTDTSRVTVSHDIQTLLDDGNLQTQTQVGGHKTATTLMQVVHEGRKLKLTGEYQRTDIDDAVTDIVAARADYQITDGLAVSVEKQFSLQDEGAADQTTVGVVATPNDNLTLSAEQKISDSGTATILGVKADMSEKFALTGEYAIAVDSAGESVVSSAIGTEITPNEKTKITTAIGIAKTSGGDTAATLAVMGEVEPREGTKIVSELALAGAGNSRETSLKVSGESDVKFGEETTIAGEATISSSATGDNTTTLAFGGTSKIDEDTQTEAKVGVGTSAGVQTTTVMFAGTKQVSEDVQTETKIDMIETSEGSQSTTYTFGTKQKLTDELSAVSSRSFGDSSDGTHTADDTYSLVREKDGKKLEGSLSRAYSQGTEEVSESNIFGLSGDVNDKWALTGTYEKGDVKNLDGTNTERDAIALAAAYVNKDEETGEDLQSSTKIEFRKDDGEKDSQQYLLYHATEGKINSALSVFSKIELSKTRNITDGYTEAAHREFVLGGAYRPITHDRLNMLGRYTYLQDKSPGDQEDMSDIEYESSHVIAAEAIYDLTEKWQLAEKFAYRLSKEKVTGFDFTKTHTWLMIHRLNYRVDRDWTIGGEFRTLTQEEASDQKRGFLFEVARNVGEYAQLGVGYDFTDFNDDLTDLDYTTQGPFVRLTGKLYDRTPEEIERAKQRWLEEKIKKWAWVMVHQELSRKSSPILSELNEYFILAQKASEVGNLEESSQIYKDIIMAGQMMYEEAAEYIRGRVEREEKLQEMKTLADQYFKNGQYEKAKKILEKILEEAEYGMVE
ncbi:MAG: hypothetical protein P9X22_08240 [Candidatus Zapsychrus exili]|nr:hypothetical protein [Candidatus Zapsychrus exili]